MTRISEVTRSTEYIYKDTHVISTWRSKISLDPYFEEYVKYSTPEFRNEL